MAANDPFGLNRERLIKNSRVRMIFTPHQPIQSRELFFGRQNEVQRLLEHLDTPGQHALLYGDRGVGKSSVANVAATIVAVVAKITPIFKRCDSSDTFESIVTQVLRGVQFSRGPAEVRTTHKEGGKAGIKLGIVEAGVGSDRETAETFRPVMDSVSPSVVAEALKNETGLLVVDEADAIANSQDRKRIAELIKLLSDNGSKFKLLVVGIAETGELLTGAHPSVHRCLKETKLGRMTPAELREIVAKGAHQLGLKFTEAAVSAIVSLSAGYAHFTHLLALKCAESAIALGQRDIDVEQVRSALGLAVQDAEGTLKGAYDEAVRSHGTQMYKTILAAAATCGALATEFTAADLRVAIERVSGEVVEQQALNNFFTRLMSDNESTVLRRVAKGVYRFNDPRMPSYVKIACGMM